MYRTALIIPNKSAYLYNDHDVQKIFSTIERELRIVKAWFIKTERKEFQL